MKKQTEKNGKRIGGLPADMMMIPIILALIILHILLVYLIIRINSTSNTLSTTLQRYDEYSSEATALLADSSLRSETVSSFVLMPQTGDGQINSQPLIAFAEELNLHRLGSQVVERYRQYDVEQGVLDKVMEAAGHSDSLYGIQLHALSLMNSVYPFADLPELSSISLVELTAEEQAMTDEQKVAAARALILGADYSQSKQAVSANINAAVGTLKSESTHLSMEMEQYIQRMRQFFWIVTGAIIYVLVVTFILLNMMLITPLKRSTRQIEAGEPLNEKYGSREIRMITSSYNDNKWRRNTLDDILQSVTETDRLTGLPNRYRYEQYLVEYGESGYSLAVFLFYVNFLKETNLKYGRAAGNALVKTAAECITSSFELGQTLIQGESHCFRFGGAEFAALIKDCTEEGADQVAARLNAELERRQINMAVGYTYTEEIGMSSFMKLMKDAEDRMEKQKAEKTQGDESKGRREALEGALQSLTETDNLTGLPNRYRYEQILVGYGESGYSLAVFIFDLNYLQETNEKHGRSAGNTLVRAAADCITTSFNLDNTLIQGETHCFRFAGEEFAAIIKGCTQKGADQVALRLKAELDHRHVNMAVGYAYAQDIGTSSFMKLMKDAEEGMQKQKEEKLKEGFDFDMLVKPAKDESILDSHK